MTGKSKLALLEKDGAIATITLNRGDAMNAFDDDLAGDFCEVVKQVADDANVRVVILRGAGPAFCGGADIATFARNLDNPGPMVQSILGKLNLAARMLRDGPRMTIASVHGVAAGIGVSFAIQSDFCIAAAGAKLIPGYALLGLAPDGGGTKAAVERMGVRPAIQFYLGEDVLDADNALRLGLVDQVVPDAELESATRALAERLARNAPLAIERTKALLRKAPRTPYPQQLQDEQDAIIAGMETKFYRDAVESFEKNSPIPLPE